MPKNTKKVSTLKILPEDQNRIDAYIETFPDNVKVLLKKVREVIKNSAPDASETIKYRMPTYYLFGNLVHFAAYKKHIGFYPTPSGITPFKKELSKFVTSKGAIQFPIDKPIPYNLIAKIVKLRVIENLKMNKKSFK